MLLGNALCSASDVIDVDTTVSAGFFSSDRLLTDTGSASYELVSSQLHAKAGEHVSAFSDVSFGSRAYFGSACRFNAREAWVDLGWEDLDLRVGRQIIPWGRADRLNPTDSLTSRDYRILSMKEEDQRIGNDAILMRLRRDGFVMSGVWLYSARPTRIALPTFLPSLDLVDSHYRGSFGLKLDRPGAGVDWSVSGYSGIDTSPALAGAVLANGFATPYLTNRKINRLGGDFALGSGSYTLRGEAAFTRATTDDSTRYLPSAYIYAVLGIDRVFPNGTTVEAQVLTRFVTSQFMEEGVSTEQKALVLLARIAAGQPVRSLEGVSFRITQSMKNDSLHLELSGISYLEHQGALLLPRTRFQVSDSLTMSLGGDFFFGNKGSLVGAFKANRSVFTGLSLAI